MVSDPESKKRLNIPSGGPSCVRLCNAWIATLSESSLGKDFINNGRDPRDASVSSKSTCAGCGPICEAMFTPNLSQAESS